MYEIKILRVRVLLDLKSLPYRVRAVHIRFRRIVVPV